MELLTDMRGFFVFWLVSLAVLVLWDLWSRRPIQLGKIAVEAGVWPALLPIWVVLWAASELPPEW